MQIQNQENPVWMVKKRKMKDILRGLQSPLIFY